MNAAQLPAVKLTTREMRRWLFTASILVFITGIQLFILTEQTGIYFSWTVTPNLTAAFLGAAYWSSCILELLASRQRVWAQARIAVPAVLVFTGLTFVVTLIHFDKFQPHLNSSNLITQVATLAWVVVYAAVPFFMLVLLIRQRRVPGNDPPRLSILPNWLRLILVIHALMMLVLGAALFLAPAAAISFWPWPLTPLTGRAVGAWLLGLGAAVAEANWENDWPRVRVAAYTYAAFGALQFIALARYSSDMNWSGLASGVYVLFMLSVLFVGVYGWLAVRRIDQQRAGGRDE